jgi:hypothetical protein
MIEIGSVNSNIRPVGLNFPMVPNAAAAFSDFPIRPDYEVGNTGQPANHGATVVQNAQPFKIQRANRIPVLITQGILLLGFYNSPATTQNFQLPGYVQGIETPSQVEHFH